jgi:hypothetical protein
MMAHANHSVTGRLMGDETMKLDFESLAPLCKEVN